MSIIIGKELLMPLIGFAVVYVLYMYDIINRVLSITVLVIYAAPTSKQLLMICTAHKNQVDNISKMFLVMYATAVIPLMLWTMGLLTIFYLE